MIPSLLRYPSAALLFVQLVGVVLYPWMESATGGHAAFGVFGILVLGIALRMVRRSKLAARLEVGRIPHLKRRSLNDKSCLLGSF